MKDITIQGNTLNIESACSDRSANSPYMLSKCGIKGVTKWLAKLLIPYGITVNDIAQGATATPLINLDNNELSNPQKLIGRLVTIEEVTSMAVMLLSDIGKLIIGDIIYMTGGGSVVIIDDFFLLLLMQNNYINTN